MDSDSSSYYETTYSEDERIANALRQERKLRERQAAAEDRARKELFENLAERDLSIFDLQGLKIVTFRHLKLKFSFHPATISNLVNGNIRFYVSLKYVGKNWRVKRDSLPANYKWKIYGLFYDQTFFIIDDENILSVIMKIYEILVTWVQKEEQFRLDKFKRYKKPIKDEKDKGVELDSDDEQIFLNQEQRIELYQKRAKILKRMIPPKR